MVDEFRYIHVGFGKPYVRSFHITKCVELTSTCIKRNYYSGLVVEAKYASHILGNIFNHILKVKPVNMYSYSHRVYSVYPYSNSLWNLLKILADLSYRIYSYCKTYECIEYIIDSIIGECIGGLDKCEASAIEWLNYIDRILSSRRTAGRKALYTRFLGKTRAAVGKFTQYFPNGLEDKPIFTVDSMSYSGWVEDSLKILRKFYSDEVASRYANSICRNDSVYLFARDDIFIIAPGGLNPKFSGNSSIACFGDQHIFIDDYSEAKSYIVFKLINTRVLDNKVIRVMWVSILGYDKYTNQIFLHYVPPTLSLHRVETCRKWLLGIVNDFGAEREDYILIEV